MSYFRRLLLFCVLGSMAHDSDAIATYGNPDQNISATAVPPVDYGHEAELSLAVSPTNANIQVVAGHGPPSSPGELNIFITRDRGSSWSRFPVPVEPNPNQNESNCLRSDPTVSFAEDGTEAWVTYLVTVYRTPPGTNCITPSVAILRTEVWGIRIPSPFSGLSPAQLIASGPNVDKPFVTSGRTAGGVGSVFVSFSSDSGTLRKVRVYYKRSDIPSWRVLTQAVSGAVPAGTEANYSSIAVSNGFLAMAWEESAQSGLPLVSWTV